MDLIMMMKDLFRPRKKYYYNIIIVILFVFAGLEHGGFCSIEDRVHRIL